MRFLPALAISLALGLSFAGVASARSARVNQVPNGTVNRCANCHVNPAGGGPRNAFGTVIETSFLSTPGASGVVLWGPALAALDSDGDGRSNGLELQDPSGSWNSSLPAPGNPLLVTQPGTPDSPPAVPALSTMAAGVLALSLLLAVGAGARTPPSQRRHARD